MQYAEIHGTSSYNIDVHLCVECVGILGLLHGQCLGHKLA